MVTALTIAYNGAATNTQTAMTAVLGLQGLLLDQVNRANIAITSAPIAPQHPFEMVIDRLFAMVLRDRQIGTLLFLGVIRSPR